MSFSAASPVNVAEPLSDNHLWRLGVLGITREMQNLPPTAAAAARSAIAQLMAVKAAMHAVVETADGATACATCGGMCCRCGKYHFSAIDLVAYLMTGKEIFVPNFEGEGCLFLNGDQCLMPPDYRPFNCITFVCEILEDRLSADQKAAFYGMERELSHLYKLLQQCFPDPRMQRSVMSFAQDEQ